MLYAVDESYCLDANTQKGTVLAIVECSSYGLYPEFGIADNPTDSTGQNIYAISTHTYSNASDDAHVELAHVTLNSSFAYTAQEYVMEVGCKVNFDCQVQVNATIRFSFCTNLQDKARPYFLTVPQEWTLPIPINMTTGHHPLFNVLAKVK